MVTALHCFVRGIFKRISYRPAVLGLCSRRYNLHCQIILWEGRKGQKRKKKLWREFPVWVRQGKTGHGTICHRLARWRQYRKSIKWTKIANGTLMEKGLIGTRGKMTQIIAWGTFSVCEDDKRNYNETTTIYELIFFKQGLCLLNRKISWNRAFLSCTIKFSYYSDCPDSENVDLSRCEECQRHPRPLRARSRHVLHQQHQRKQRLQQQQKLQQPDSLLSSSEAGDREPGENSRRRNTGNPLIK